MTHEEFERFSEKFIRGDNWHNIDYSRGNLGYGWLHYAIICNLLPDRVLCIGSKYGYIPAVCAMACRDCASGVVDFVDAGFSEAAGDKAHWGGAGVWRNVDTDEYFGEFGLKEFITIHPKKTIDFFKNNKKIPGWGYINIDGDHSYDGVKYDFETFWPKLAIGGYLSIHDIYAKHQNGEEYGTCRFWKEVSRKYKNTFVFPGKQGLGIVQKSL